MTTEPTPIRLRVANQKAYLWDLNDIQRLRVEHHICGSLHGTLPQVTQQNVFLGLPLVLAPEEVVLLVKNRIAVIVDDPQAHTDPSLAQAHEYDESRAAAIENQQRTTYEYEQQKRIEMQQKHRDKIELKHKLKFEKQQQQQQLGFDVVVPDLPRTSDAATDLPIETPQTPCLGSIPYAILIDPNSSSYPWYDPDASLATYSTLEAAQEARVWNYPTTPLQRSKCRVFEDLWNKGYYMGGGLRFGGDFLVYPGDPLRYHSHFTLTILATPTTTIMPLDLVAYGRLATAVKKAHLLASWNERELRTDYLSLEWAAFG